MVDSEINEKALQDVILKGPSNPDENGVMDDVVDVKGPGDKNNL